MKSAFRRGSRSALRAGQSAQEACEQAVRRVNTLARRRGLPPAGVAFLALGRDGQVGAACTATARFPYAVARAGRPVELLPARALDAGEE